MRDVVSALPEVTWPAVTVGRAAQLLALQYQLESSQWLSADEIETRQQRQLDSIVAHAYHNVPFYRRRFDDLGVLPDELTGSGAWRSISLLTRSDIQSSDGSLCARFDNAKHGQISKATTSGSSGQPVTVHGTTITRLFWDALTLRQHLWHRHDFSGKLAVARYFQPPFAGRNEMVAANWGSATAGIVDTGPSVAINIRLPVSQQAEWLVNQNPDYLLSYPSNLAALARHCAAYGQQVSKLRQVFSFGETLEPHVRSLCREQWGVDVIDAYSSQEVGYIAFECPEYGCYHVQSESVLVEVLDDQGRACLPGQLGRVVVTALQNFAMPLLRYEIGDWAEPAEACRCGRGLPTLRRILGRQRNMFQLPSGERFFPAFEFDTTAALDQLPPVRQFQIIQKSLEEVEVVLAVFRSLNADEEDQIRSLITTSLRYPFQVRITYVETIPPGPTGKYEDFRCDLPAY